MKIVQNHWNKKHFCSLAVDHCQVCESQICAKRFAKVHLASESDVRGGETKTLCKRDRSCSSRRIDAGKFYNFAKST